MTLYLSGMAFEHHKSIQSFLLGEEVWTEDVKRAQAAITHTGTCLAWVEYFQQEILG